MKRFLIFVFALFIFGAVYGDDIVCDAGSYINDDGECVLCPAGTYSGAGATVCTECIAEYPNSAPGATDSTQCYSDWKTRTCQNIGCTVKKCQYVAYGSRYRKSGKWVYEDIAVKEGCSEEDCLSLPNFSALPGYRVNGTSCEICPANTYSTGGENAKCEPCPNGAFTNADGATARADCMRILNYRAPNAATPTQIYLNGYKNTSPALAIGIGDDVFYANMKLAAGPIPGQMHVGYDNKTYVIVNNGFHEIDNTFYITTTANTDSFEFKIAVVGNFTVDWGDGNTESIETDACGSETLSHTYDVPGKYVILLSGRATAYCRVRRSGKWVYNAIQFTDTTKIAEIDGSLGAVFPTLDDGTNPCFEGLFSGATNMTGIIPPFLFDGITGSPESNLSGENMFNSVFDGCSGLTGQIPVGLFGKLSGAPGTNTFVNAFRGCTGLTGPAARNPDGTPLYDIEYYDGLKWIDVNPNAFTDMYTNSGISDL